MCIHIIVIVVVWNVQWFNTVATDTKTSPRRNAISALGRIYRNTDTLILTINACIYHDISHFGLATEFIGNID